MTDLWPNDAGDLSPQYTRAGYTLRDNVSCKWCRRHYHSPQEQKAHETGTNPRYITDEHRYVCEDSKSLDYYNDLRSNLSSRALKPNHSVEALSSEAQSVAPLNYPFSASEIIRRTSSLLDVQRSNERHVVSAEGELSEDFTLDALDIQEDRMEDEYLHHGQHLDDDEVDSENDEVGDLVERRDADAMTTFYGTSMPAGGSFGSFSYRTSSASPFASSRKQPLGLASPRTYETAKSSLASYATATSHPNPQGVYLNTRTSLQAYQVPFVIMLPLVTWSRTSPTMSYINFILICDLISSLLSMSRRSMVWFEKHCRRYLLGEQMIGQYYGSTSIFVP
jgi:hypothetical protein